MHCLHPHGPTMFLCFMFYVGIYPGATDRSHGTGKACFTTYRAATRIDLWGLDKCFNVCTCVQNEHIQN